MDNKADPLAGWPIWEVCCVPSMALQDVYGKLFIYLSKAIGKFLQSLDIGMTNFELYNLDAKKLL